MKVLVTGASGFLGSRLLPLLLQQQHEVAVVTRNAGNIRLQGWASQVSVIEGDLADAALCLRAVTGIEAVIHLAGLAHARASEQQHRQQTYLNTRQLADAANASGVKSFVYISSIKARYPTHSSYGHYKQMSEQYLLSLSGTMRCTCLRPGIVYGTDMRNNLQTLLRLLRRPSLPCFISTDKRISMISVQDCNRAVVAALEQPTLSGRIWELSDGVQYKLPELCLRIRQRLHLPQPRFTCPRLFVWLGLAMMGILPGLRRRGAGLNTYRALYEEDYVSEQSFAEASGVKPSLTFWDAEPGL